MRTRVGWWYWVWALGLTFSVYLITEFMATVTTGNEFWIMSGATLDYYIVPGYTIQVIDSFPVTLDGVRMIHDEESTQVLSKHKHSPLHDIYQYNYYVLTDKTLAFYARFLVRSILRTN